MFSKQAVVGSRLLEKENICLIIKKWLSLVNHSANAEIYQHFYLFCSFAQIFESISHTSGLHIGA